MPRLNTTLKRNKYVLRRRPVSETSISGNSDSSSTSALRNNMAETDSVTNTKSENSTSSLNTDYSSDEHNYSFKKRTRALQYFDTRSVFKDASNFNQSTDLTAENADIIQDKINLGLNKISRITKISSKRIRSRSNRSKSSTINEYSKLMNTYKQSDTSLSKNAINAKLNRIKKKQQTMQLENEITSLREENTNLQSCIECNSKTISSLRNEVKYLRNVLANSKELGSILRNVCQSTNPNITSPIDRTSSYQEINVDTNMPNGLRADSFISEMDNTLKYESLPTEENDELMLWDKSLLEVNDLSNIDFNEDVGVCLHVSNKKVSLELCASCNQSSTKSNLESMDFKLLSE